jgi:hypothetical protein
MGKKRLVRITPYPFGALASRVAADRGTCIEGGTAADCLDSSTSQPLHSIRNGNCAHIQFPQVSVIMTARCILHRLP